jgi:hypothetical protein
MAADESETPHGSEQEVADTQQGTEDVVSRLTNLFEQNSIDSSFLQVIQSGTSYATTSNYHHICL